MAAPKAVVLPAGPAQGPARVVRAGPVLGQVSRRPRPRLPFTGANLLTFMGMGAGLIVLGLVLKRWELSAQAP